MSGNEAYGIWSSWCHCQLLSLASVKSRLVLFFWYWLTRVVLEKGPLNVCVRACVRVLLLWSCVRVCVCVQREHNDLLLKLEFVRDLSASIIQIAHSRSSPLAESFFIDSDHAVSNVSWSSWPVFSWSPPARPAAQFTKHLTIYHKIVLSLS